MKPTALLTLIKTDNHNILRDKTLLMMLFLPFLFVFSLKYAMPFLNESVPNLADYYPLVLGVLGTVSALLGGYIIAFVMLDEKDENVFVVLQTMPFPITWFVMYRLFLAFVWGFCFAFLAFLILDIASFSLSENIFYALLCSQSSPVVMLFIVVFASDKIEGLTFLKGVNFFSVLPVLGFFVPKLWGYVFSVFPFYWNYKAIQESNPYFALISILTHVVFLFVIMNFMKEKNG